MGRDQHTLLGLDFGSHHITAVICELVGSTPVVKGVGHSETGGMEKGELVDADSYNASVERAIKRAEQIAGLSPKRIITNVPYQGIKFVTNMGLLLSPDDNHIFTESDVKECIRRSKNIVKPPSKKIMHVIPLSYTVAGRQVDDPIGQSGNPLEVNTHVVLGEVSTLNDIVRLSRVLGRTVEGIAFDGLASSQVYLSDDERRNGGIVLDMGGQFTKAHIVKDNKLIKSAYIKYGSDTITADIATCLKVSIPEAERLKVMHGQLPPEAVDPEDRMEISTEMGRTVIKREHLSQIIGARVTELISMLSKTLQLSDYDESWPFVLGGGGCQLKGIDAWVSPSMQRPVRTGILPDIQLEDVQGASGLGLIYYAIRTGAVTLPQTQQKGFWSRMKLSLSK